MDSIVINLENMQARCTKTTAGYAINKLNMLLNNDVKKLLHYQIAAFTIHRLR